VKQLKFKGQELAQVVSALAERYDFSEIESAILRISERLERQAGALPYQQRRLFRFVVRKGPVSLNQFSRALRLRRKPLDAALESLIVAGLLERDGLMFQLGPKTH